MNVNMVIPVKLTVMTTVATMSVIAVAVDPSVVAAAIVTVITALTGGIILIINALAAVREKVAQVSAKADVIGGHVDGMNTKSGAKIDEQEKIIASLTQQLNEEKQKAVLLAQSTAVTSAAKKV